MNLRTVVLVLGLLAVLSTAAGGYLYYHSVRESALKDAEIEIVETNEALRDDVARLISFNQDEVKALAGFEQLQGALVDHQKVEALLRANGVLDNFARGFAYDVCFLIDSLGNTIASSNRNQPDSFVGVNYHFRKYFQDAIQGRPSVEMALGTVTGIRGIFVSHPVYLAGRAKPIGVVVIKVSTRDLDRVFLRPRNMDTLLVNNDGIIFASNRENWILNHLWKLSPEELERIRETKQFGKGPWNWTGLEKMTDNQALDSSGADYTIREMTIENCHGWRIISLYKPETISGKIFNPLVGKTGYIAIILCLMVGAAVTFLYAMAQRDIRGREESEDALRQSEEKFSKVFQYAPILMTLSNVDDGMYLDVNDQFCEVSGFSRDECIGKTSVDLGWISREDRIRLFEELQARGSVRGMDLKLLTKDKREIHCVYNGELIQTGNQRLLLSIARDITKRRKAEEDLRQSDERFRNFLNATDDLVFIKDQHYRYVYVNKANQVFFGLSEQDILGKADFELMPQKLAGQCRASDQRAIAEKDVVTTEEQYAVRIYQVRKFPVRLGYQEIGVGGFIQDITRRIEAEEQLTESEERYRSLVEDSFDGIFIQKGPKIMFANSRLCEMLGYSMGEFEGIDHWLIYHPDSQDLTRRRAIARMRGEDVIPQYEVMLQRKDGSSFPADISARLVQVDGKPGIQIWLRDISGRRRAEEAQKRLSIAVEQAAEAIVITDPSGTIQYINPAFESITGYSRDEAIGENSRILRSGHHDEAFFRKLWETLTNGEVWTGQLLNRKKDGTLYRADVTISPVCDSSGEIINYVAVTRDITREFELRGQLLQAQKMEAIGTLAAGVAHDFNNLLQVVTGYSELLLTKANEQDPFYSYLERINQAGQKGADLVRRLLTFGRKSEYRPRPLNLNYQIE
ncbi:MAG: PAS domain S-box protein, partial [Desulfomonilaceae bacterium]